MDTLSEITDEFDSSCSKDSNYQHLKHMFEGYRALIIDRESCENPYHPGGPRSHSFDVGVKLAIKDLEENK